MFPRRPSCPPNIKFFNGVLSNMDPLSKQKLTPRGPYMYRPTINLRGIDTALSFLSFLIKDCNEQPVKQGRRAFGYNNV